MDGDLADSRFDHALEGLPESAAEWHRNEDLILRLVPHERFEVSSWVQTDSWFGLTIEYTDRHSTQTPRAKSGAILPLVHRLVNSIHNAALACYTNRHSSVIAAKGSILEPAH